jgi:hypothetical protein
MVIEWAPFRLREAASEAALLSASESLQRDFLERQPGFVRRELLRGEGRDWVDLLYWESAEALAAAMQRAGQSPVCFAYFQVMEQADHAQPGAGVSQFRLVQTYSG